MQKGTAVAGRPFVRDAESSAAYADSVSFW